MSGKYSDNRFFLAHYGCCIPTESYVWIIVVLFITTVLVLLFCMLSTATVRWMYKRRMRKRLQDLKRKYQLDQLKAQEFEAKLNYMAQKNKTAKNVPNNDSKEGKLDKLTILVNPDQNQGQGVEDNKNVANDNAPNKKSLQMVPAPVNYDTDDTPLAQSTLASRSATKANYKNQWFMPQQQKIPGRPMSKESPQMVPPSLMNTAIPGPPPVREVVQKVPPPETRAQPPPEGPNSSLLKPPTKGNSKELAHPVTTSSSSGMFEAGTPKSSPITMTPPTASTTGTTGSSFVGSVTSAPTTGTTGSRETAKTKGSKETADSKESTGSRESTIPKESAESKETSGSSGTSGNSGTSGTSATSGTSNQSSSLPVQSPAPVSATDDKEPVPNGDIVKANVQYEQDDIVSPTQQDKTEERKEGAGGKTEWKYYYMNSASDGKKRPPSSFTKSSTSYRPSSGSWRFDSTGSSRLDLAKQGTSSSSSFIKTNSTHYKTASVESFPHGAFAFEQ